MENWRKSSYSGPGDGNECVEIANAPTRIFVRDSKAPTRPTLFFTASVFAVFLDALKEPAPTG
ncbi:DUF397 domain-containing protein [Streptomyces sp. bgisy022]|uniref:DUF397 domain-containing protein n=1 Tax=Streptomyces sp. bgisy022 TaxID=3413769 RepID=UPI003D75BFF7